MTNKPMLSVELRALLNNCADYMEGSASGKVKLWHKELRALLDKPAPEPVPVAWMRFDDDQKAIFTRTKRADKSEPLYAHPTAYRHSKPAAQHQGEPVAWVECSPAWLKAGGDCATAPRICVGRDGISHLHPAHSSAEQPAAVADHAQCEECKGWGYHENHHEGGGTECGGCGGSGNATVAAVMPDVDELAQIIRKVDGSHTLGAGSLAEAILEEVARLNGVKP